MNYDVAIVGAGIVGAACAAALASAGLRVVVIDRTGIASGTTAAGMGHIVMMDDSEAQFALTSYSQNLWDSLSHELPPSGEYEHCGTIWVAADDEELNEARRKHEFYASHGITTELLDERSLKTSEPNLRDGLVGGLLVRSDSVVYQLTATQFLIDKAQKNGAELRIGQAAAAITDEGLEFANGETFSAGAVVNAAGVNAPELSPSLRIVKKKGHLVITERYPEFAKHQLIELGYLKSAHSSKSDSVAFNLQPRATGQVLLGSSRQFGAQDGDIDRAILRRMTERAFEYMPALRNLSAVRVWTGFRPATPDNLPFIGKVPESKNTYIAAGHEGLGITTSLATAELIADSILGRESAIPPEPYSPGRPFSEH
jgi:glycine/D-amino acid oxidase-like deaminating enzyme